MLILLVVYGCIAAVHGGGGLGIHPGIYFCIAAISRLYLLQTL